MIIYPALDLLGGRAVRLKQGRFSDVTAYATDPAEALRQFAAAGAQWTHVVDLDGARAGRPIQHELISELARAASVRLQMAGGFREREEVARMLDAGVGRVVVGSLAVHESSTVRGWINEFGPERIALSLDVRVIEGEPMVATAGWTQDSGCSLWEIAALFPAARHMLITDIGRDGMLDGPNVQLYEQVCARLPCVAVQASGGVSTLADIERLPTDGAIIGKALWEGHILLEEAIGLARA